jgi:hypothetical protein
MTLAAPLRRALYRLPSVWGSCRSLARPFVATFHEKLEMRYLWREPAHVNDAQLIAALGQEPHSAGSSGWRLVLLGAVHALLRLSWFICLIAATRPLIGLSRRPAVVKMLDR